MCIWTVLNQILFLVKLFSSVATLTGLFFLRYVTYTRTEEEHNLVVFQFFRRIYYKVTQQITEGTELKVWIGRDYATLLGLGMGKFTYG